MKKWIVILFAMLPSLAMAAGAGVPLDKANVDLSDKASLQNGAKLFMNYCFACHSTQYQRYERVADDLGIVARVRGADWIYTYLRSFYVDPSRPFGVCIGRAARYS